MDSIRLTSADSSHVEASIARWASAVESALSQARSSQRCAAAATGRVLSSGLMLTSAMRRIRRTTVGAHRTR
jgi:hypothetical protein